MIQHKGVDDHIMGTLKVKPKVKNKCGLYGERVLMSGRLLEGMLAQHNKRNSPGTFQLNNVACHDYTFSNLDISNIELINCDLSDCVFEGCNLSQITITGSRLTEVLITECTVSTMDIYLTEMTDMRLDMVPIDKLLLSHCQADRLRVSGCAITTLLARKCNFADAEVDNTLLYASHIHGSDLSGGELRCNIIETILSDCWFGGARVIGGCIVNSKIVGEVPEDIIMVCTSLIGCDFTGSYFDFAKNTRLCHLVQPRITHNT